jgi:hypothetical protein
MPLNWQFPLSFHVCYGLQCRMRMWEVKVFNHFLSNNEKFINSDWLRAVQFFRNTQCQKMKYIANLTYYKIQPFIAEN